MAPSHPSRAPSAHLAARDYRDVLTLLGELGELVDASAAPGDHLHHLTARAGALIGADALWWSVVTHRDLPHAARRDAQMVTRSHVHGLDAATLARWESDYLAAQVYRQHPMWRAFGANAGCLRSARRDELVDDRVWYRDPHVAAWSSALGYDDIVASAAPLGDGSEAYLVALRPWGARRFGRRERVVLELINGGARFIYRRHLASARGVVGRARAESLRVRLAPRHRAVLDLLLTGRSEKQLADALGLRPRSAHKYIEQVYRAFRVASRAELMSLWIP